MVHCSVTLHRHERILEHRYGQWRPASAVINCSMTFHTSWEDTGTRHGQWRPASAVVHCSVTFCSHRRIMVPRYGRRRPTSALAHCTMTFHTSLEDVGAIILPYELFDQRKLVSDKLLQSLYSLYSPLPCQTLFGTFTVWLENWTKDIKWSYHKGTFDKMLFRKENCANTHTFFFF